MALQEFEKATVEVEMEHFIQAKRPPVDMRDQYDLAYRVEGQSVIIFDIRPYWRDPEQKIEGPVAKATYVKKTDSWKVYWHRADQKWHRYPPKPEVRELKDFLKLVDKDANGCFWG